MHHPVARGAARRFALLLLLHHHQPNDNSFLRLSLGLERRNTLRQVVLDAKVLSAWALCAHVQASEHRHTGRTQDLGERIGGLQDLEHILIQGADLHHLTDASSFYQARVCVEAAYGSCLPFT